MKLQMKTASAVSGKKEGALNGIFGFAGKKDQET
jgi:hypothetical protein